MANYSVYSDNTQMPKGDEKRFFLCLGAKSLYSIFFHGCEISSNLSVKKPSSKAKHGKKNPTFVA